MIENEVADNVSTQTDQAPNIKHLQQGDFNVFYKQKNQADSSDCDNKQPKVDPIEVYIKEANIEWVNPKQSTIL